jgi:membrane protease YdiL (CAAX protease family)
MVIAATWVSLCAAIDRLVPGRWPDGSPPDGGFAIAVVATLAAATFEEVLYRGFTLRALVESGLSFWRANAIAAGLFALLHVPGWLFMGWSPRQVATTMPSVILVGLACCVARMGNASLWASITVHVANNLWGGGIFLYGLYRVVSFVR